MKDKTKTILFYDGTCGFCNAWIRFVIKNERNQQIKFAHLDSNISKETLGFDPQKKKPDTIIFLQEGRIFYKSDAILHLAKYLRYPWTLLNYLKIIPRFIRNGCYHWISRNRYKIAGKQEACAVPSAELRERFLG